MKEVAQINAAFKEAGIDIDKPMIFFGEEAALVKAVAEHVGFPGKKSIFDVKINEWLAKNPKPVPNEEPSPAKQVEGKENIPDEAKPEDNKRESKQ